MNVAERGVRRIDAFQQRHRASAFAVGLVKKFGDDNGGALAARLTFAVFTTIFPLLLLLVTGLALVLAGHPGIRHTVLDSAYGEIPVVGKQLRHNIHALQRNSAFGFAVGLAGLVYGIQGLAGVGLQIMETVWYLPKAIRPNYLTRMGRSLTFVVVLGLGLVVTTFLSNFGSFGAHGLLYGAGAEVLAAAANVGIYLVAFRVLTPKQVETHCLVPGAIAGGVLWTLLQAFGGYLVAHYLRNDNAVYGTFGTVLGLIAWFAVAAEMTVYCAELNAFLAHRLWPRGMVQPPLTKADQVLAALQATTNQFRPEVEVVARVHGRPMSQGEYLAHGGIIGADEIGTVRRVPKSGPPGGAAPEPAHEADPVPEPHPAPASGPANGREPAATEDT